MKTRFRNMVVWSLLVFGGLSLFQPTPVAACPMCKNANEEVDSRPRAYMYSILFMLAVPATVFTGFGIGMYRLSKREQAAVDESELSDNQIDE